MASEAEQRAAVVRVARSWLGTPYHHNAMVKGAGVDCGMLLVAVYGEAGVIPAEFRPEPYAFDWHLHRSAELYLQIVERFASAIPRETAGPGDIGVWRFGRTFADGVILTEPPIGMHAARKDRMVTLVDTERDADLAGRETVFYSPWGC